MTLRLSSPKHINETQDVIKKQLEVSTKLRLRTHLNVDDILELLKFIVSTTYFKFRGTIYQHLSHSNGKSGVNCNWKSLHGMARTVSYFHITNNLQTETMEDLCG